MISLKTASIVLALTVLGACTSADRFGSGSGGVGADGASGSVNDPTSPAYFAQAVGDRVLFAVNESTLTSASMAVLDGQATWLTQNPEYTALIEGHADEQGTRQYNIALGERRATAVHTYLVSRGVASDRLRTISYGKERPVELCSDEACYSQNRRAVTVLAVGAGV